MNQTKQKPIINISSIEYGHIYINQQFGKDQIESIKLLKNIEIHQPESSRVILIDDYSPNLSFDRFDLNSYLTNLELYDAMPDAIVCESELIVLCKKVLEEISDKRLKNGIKNYYLGTGRFPCSLFIASWYLLRLGAFGNPKVNCILGSPDRLIAKELITIVPDYFKSAEDKALEIVSKSKYTDYSPKIKQVFFKSNKKSWSDWNDFDPREYEYRNYGKQILHEDAEIIKNAIQGLEQMDLKRGSLKRVMDIGTGPNLYPTMLLTPYISWDAKIELIEYAKPNLKYLRTVKETGNNKDWIKFEKLMTEMGGEKYKGSINKLLSISEIKEGNIFRLPKNTYDAVVSFFVTESITDDREKFKESLLSLINSLKPGGIIVAAHMVNSREYFAGENTRFPATNLSVNEIEEAYKGLADISLSLIGHTGFKPARKGYKGMALIIGRKITSTS